ncbi:unnamed protein product, partial [marine sediment metagenome]
KNQIELLGKGVIMIDKKQQGAFNELKGDWSDIIFKKIEVMVV